MSPVIAREKTYARSADPPSYGTATVPDYANLSRKDALKAIADFPTVSKAGASGPAAAQTLLDGSQGVGSETRSGLDGHAVASNALGASFSRALSQS